MTIDPYYLAAFIFLLSWAIAFGLGWFLRKAQGERDDGPKSVTWSDVTSAGPVDFGPNEIGKETPRG